MPANTLALTAGGGPNASSGLAGVTNLYQLSLVLGGTDSISDTLAVNAGAYAGATKAAQVQAAITDAAATGKTYVFVPNSLLPYVAANVTFNNAVRMIREGSNPQVYDVQAYGAFADGVTDDRAAIQAAINGVGIFGGSVFFPVGRYVIGSPGLDISGKDGISLVGIPATSFNEGSTIGSQLLAGANNMTVLTDSNANVQHLGPQVHAVHFGSNNKTGVTLVNYKNTNHWSFRDTAFRIEAGSDAATTAVTLDLTQDNAYALFDHCTWSLKVGTGINVLNSDGFVMYACNISVTSGAKGLVANAAAAHLGDGYFLATKWDGVCDADGAFVNLGGVSIGNTFVACSFEDDSSSFYTVLLTSATAEHPSRTYFLGCQSTANHVIKIGASCNDTFVLALNSPGAPGDVLDQGSDTPFFWPARDSSGNMVVSTPASTLHGFNGAAAIAKPTVSGAKGGNIALASLLTTLATYGLITDGTTA